MARVLNINEFLEKAADIPVADVRTPAEFEHGHIPGAINLPIFSNEERAVVGTIYKQVSRNEAMLKALEIVGPKMRRFAEDVKKLCPGKEILVHCWRGGMRSNSMAWLYETIGYRTYTLHGGYKSFRREVLRFLALPFRFVVVGGLTGTGKTEILNELAHQGFQVLDLEGLANHKGSVFGGLGQPPQPTSEHFENMVYTVLSGFDSNQIILAENESHSIGGVFIPNEIFDQIITAPTLHLELDRSHRIERLVREYAGFPPANLKEAVLRIQKRLGGLNTKLCLEAIDKGDFETVADITLHYYDKAYFKYLNEKNQSGVEYITLNEDNVQKSASIIINHLKQYTHGNTKTNAV